jgi:probable phosphoglycerate mutase
MSCILTLVRHGETAANVDGVWHGSIDTPLTDRGRAQAARLAQHLESRRPEVKAVYSSPLQRARDTAVPIGHAFGLALRIEADLREYGIGSWEGRRFAELWEQRFFDHIRRDPDYAPHGGESPRQVTDRLAGALGRIATAHPGERVVVVVHGGALSMALAHLLDGDYTRWDRVMDNCALSELVLEPEPALLCFNRSEHLADV